MPAAAALIAGAAVSTLAVARLGTRATVTGGLVLTFAGLVVAATASMPKDYAPVLVTLVLCGLGIGLAMAPATDSVMGSLPVAKAGVGSAMNDTARLVGGAFGVAAFGTTISEVYTRQIADAAAALPNPAADVSLGSLQGALQVAERLASPGGDVLATAAREAFTEALQQASLVGAGVAALAALVALLVLPAHAPIEPSERLLPAAGVQSLSG